MGRGGPIPWPARSSDLSPCDYNLWEHLKDIVCRNFSHTGNELKTKIPESIRFINENTPKREKSKISGIL